MRLVALFLSLVLSLSAVSGAAAMPGVTDHGPDMHHLCDGCPDVPGHGVTDTGAGCDLMPGCLIVTLPDGRAPLPPSGDAVRAPQTTNIEHHASRRLSVTPPPPRS